MKIITPPAISNLEELLAVAMNPEKLTTALKQMSEMRNAVIEHLEVYTTKQKADEYLAQAQAAQTEVHRLLAETEEKAKDNDAECKERLAQFQRDQDAWTRAKEAEQAALKARRDKLMDETNALREAAGDLNGREIALHEREAELDKLSAKLTAELEKMEQRKALLNAV